MPMNALVPDRPLTSVGPATARETPEQIPVECEVLVCNPPRELVHRWGEHRLRWTLEPTPRGCRLTLEQTFGVRDEYGVYCAGWHICLAILAVVLGGHDVDRVVGSRAREFGWDALRERYQTPLE